MARISSRVCTPLSASAGIRGSRRQDVDYEPALGIGAYGIIPVESRGIWLMGSRPLDVTALVSIRGTPL